MDGGSATLKQAIVCTMNVRGLATDSLNQQTVTADSKGVVKFWRFKEAKLLHKVKKQDVFCTYSSID